MTSTLLMFSIKSKCDLQIIKQTSLKFLKLEIKLIKLSIFRQLLSS